MSVKLRTRSLRDGRQSLYLDIYHNGARYYEYLNLYLTKDNRGGHNKGIKALAEKIAADRQLKLDQNDHGFAVENHRRTSFIDYFEAQAARRASATRASWTCTLNAIKACAGEQNLTFAQVTPSWLEGFKAYLLERYARGTAYLRYNMVKTALRQAVHDEIITSSPATKIKGVRKAETQRAYLDEGELRKLAATPCRQADVKRAFLFSCVTGLRISDVRKLRWRNITGDRIVFSQKKTGGAEYIDLSDAIRSVLGERGEPDAQVFELPAGTTIGNVLRTWCAAAGVTKHVTFHVARHTFATRLLTLGADIYTVSKLLGHTTLAHTQVYAKIVDQKKRDALNLLPVLPSGNS
ncbi:MAG: site-specific integrase [Bacteroidetes bacterium]|nr:site-specific integrase [Bacteroidota bacterium]